MGLKGIFKFLMYRAFEALVVILLIMFMPSLPPDAKFSQHYKVEPAKPFEGKLALNERLNGAELWHKGDFLGPESFAEYNGELYTTLHGGDVVKLTGNHITPVVKFGKPCKGYYQEQICGRPLGLTFDKNGALYVSDAYYGIFKVDVKTGKKIQLVSVDQEINGKKPKLPNSVTVASNGDLYWTDSSSEFTLQDGIFDMFADGSGRLVHYDAKTKKNTVLIDNLHFANGIILADDESFVLAAETARSRIHRYYLKGPKKGTRDIFIDGLPGLPDNLRPDGQGGFLVPLVVGRDADNPYVIQVLGPFPLIRKLFARILGLSELGFKIINQIYPNEYAERAVHLVGHFGSFGTILYPARLTVLRMSATGDIIDSIHALDKSISGISEAFIYQNYLILGSPFNDYIGRVPLEKIGWGNLAKKTSKTTTQTPPKTTQTPTTKPTTTTKPPTTTTKPPTTTTKPPTTTTKPPTTTTKPPTTTQPPKTTQAPTTPKPTTKKPSTTQAPQQEQTQSKQTNPPPPKTTQKPTTAKSNPTPKPTTETPPTTQRPPSTTKQTAQTKETPVVNKPSQAQPVKEQPKVVPVKKSP